MTVLAHLLIALLALFPPPPEAAWVWPTQGPQVVLRDFQAPATPWGAGHRGLDLAASSERVVAPVSGVVSFSGIVADRGVITITTDEGWLVSMEPVQSVVSVGERVAKGQLIAVLVAGHCVGLCVHLGLRVEGLYLSPRLPLGILQRSVLMPWDD
jgi:murein DD-endopeptidase MepM/ murein hydrolase activator NlpD